MVAATSWVLGQASWLAPGMDLRLAGVSMMEGTTALTRMLFGATSAPRACVIAATAAFAAVYATMLAPSSGNIAGRAATLTMRPPTGPPAFMTRTASRQQRKQVRALVLNCA